MGFIMWTDANFLPMVRWPLTVTYLLLLSMIALYGLHRYWLVWLYYRHRRRRVRPATRFKKLPPVTVQLPIYNEGLIAARAIDAACRLDYPKHLLQIQVLDDSADQSAEIARRCCEDWCRQGHDVQYRHRDDRHGYKAGALDAALADAKAPFIAIFDADFVPRRDFLRKTVHFFTDPNVGMVQARWGHLNREDSLLTRSQAIFLDGHFIIEHTARNRSDRWINFNGTAGIWRRQAIESAGGWQHDTLTEDIDLSYRSQLAGWRFIFTPSVICPAELPPEINAFKSQQHRWSKGAIQTAIKLLPKLLTARIPLGVKVEAFFHLTCPMVYLYISLMALLLYPTIFVNIQPWERETITGALLGFTLFALGTASATVFYLVSQRAQGHSIRGTLVQMPVLMSIGIGIALNNARGVIEALVGHDSPFVRTPKYRSTTDTDPQNKSCAASRIRQTLPSPSIKGWMSLLELGFGFYMLECCRHALSGKSTLFSLPFLLLFASGYLYTGIASLYHQVLARRTTRTLVPQSS